MNDRALYQLERAAEALTLMAKYIREEQDTISFTGSGVAVVAVESSIFTELPDVELSAKEFSESNVISRISVNFIFSSFQSEIRAWIMI